MEIQAVYRGVPITMVGDYEPVEYATEDVQGSPSSFQFQKILVQDTDIIGIIYYQDMEMLEKYCLSVIEELTFEEADVYRAFFE